MIVKDLENRIKHVNSVWLIKENERMSKVIIIRRSEDRYFSSLSNYLKRQVINTSYERGNGGMLKIRIR